MTTIDTHPTHPALTYAYARLAEGTLSWTSGHSWTYAPDEGTAVAYWPRLDEDGEPVGGGVWVALQREICHDSGARMSRAAVLYEVSTPDADDECRRAADGVGVPTLSAAIAYYLDGDGPEPGTRSAVILRANGTEERVTFDRGSGERPPLPKGLAAEVRWDRPAAAFLVSTDPRHTLVGRAIDDATARMLRARLAAMRAAA